MGVGLSQGTTAIVCVCVCFVHKLEWQHGGYTVWEGLDANLRNQIFMGRVNEARGRYEIGGTCDNDRPGRCGVVRHTKV